MFATKFDAFLQLQQGGRAVRIGLRIGHPASRACPFRSLRSRRIGSLTFGHRTHRIATCYSPVNVTVLTLNPGARRPQISRPCVPIASHKRLPEHTRIGVHPPSNQEKVSPGAQSERPRSTVAQTVWSPTRTNQGALRAPTSSRVGCTRRDAAIVGPCVSLVLKKRRAQSSNMRIDQKTVA